VRKKLWIAVAVLGCSSDSSSWQEQYVAKLRECGVISKEGRYESLPAENWRCFLSCVSDAKCSDVIEFECNEGDELWSEQLDACFDKCDYIYDSGDDFPCKNGETTDAKYCDGEQECTDGSDEKGCDPSFVFECKDGQLVPDYAKCDEERDCDDGSDELDCPPEPADFACGDGEEIGHWQLCDGREDCEDGSDERGCAQDLCEQHQRE
jgi:hypothetical protein